jgi:L-lactate dehydrogenase complex protein LldG
MLARIRAVLPQASDSPEANHAAIARTFRRVGERSAHDRLELFLDRLIDYDTEIVQIESEAELPEAIAGVLRHANETHVLIAPEFPATWLPEGFEFQPDHALPIPVMEEAEAVLTTCETAVAASGTIFLLHGGAQGRRAITLLPDHHICLVRRDQVVEVLPEALETIDGKTRRPITTISGPSATSDIEMTRIRGVHGPRRLTVILYA